MVLVMTDLPRRRGPLGIQWPCTVSILTLTAVFLAGCGGGGTKPTSPSSVTPTPSPTPTPNPTPEQRTTLPFSGHYDHERGLYVFDSGAFTVRAEGPLDVTAQASEPTGRYQFAILRRNAPGDCSGVVASTPSANGSSQSGHWNSIAPGTYCMNMPRDPRDRSYSWSGTIIHP